MSVDAAHCLICGATKDPARLTAHEFLVDRFRYTPRNQRPRPLQPTTCERHIMREAQSTAEIEYAVMLAVLNFHTEFMKSNFSHVQVQMLDDVIDVVLTRSAPIPAEELLAQSAEGEALLREVHGAIFRSCQEALKAQIERVVGRGVKLMAAAVDPRAGRAGLTITLQATAETPPIPQMARL